MGFQGREQSDADRAEPARGRWWSPGYVARRLSVLGPRVETLESRLLLTGNTLSANSTPPYFEVPPVPAILVPLVRGTIADGGSNQAGSVVFESASIPTRLPTSGSTSPDAPVVSIRKTVTHPLELLTVTSSSPNTLGEGSIPPLILVASPASSSFDPTGAVSFSPDGPNSSGWAVAPTAAQPGDGMNGAYQAGIPDERHVELEGALDGTHNSMTLQIPVGPTTQDVGVSLRPGSGGVLADLPVLDQIALVGRDGETLARLAQFGDSQSTDAGQSVTVALNNAPTGGFLLVQISSPSGANTATASAMSATTVSGSSPFVVDIQRLETAGATASGLADLIGSLPSSARGGLGTLHWATNGTILSTTSTSPATASGSEAGTNEAGIAYDEGSPIPASNGEVEPNSDLSDDFSGRIATGPLASRSSAPLGPNLATVLFDPAPAVDRHERALAQTIDETDSEQSDGPIAGSLQADRSDSGVPSVGDERRFDRGESGDETRVTMAGLGAWPLKVAADVHRGRRIDLAALLAALPGSVGREDSPSLAVNEDDPAVDVSISLAAAASSARDHRVAPDYLTAACVVAVGMALTTGPLIPDLLALIPSRAWRWRSMPGSSSGGSGAARSSGGFGSLRRGPLGSLLRKRAQ